MDTAISAKRIQQTEGAEAGTAALAFFLDLQEVRPLFAALLSLPAPRFPLPALSPQKQKEKTHEALWRGCVPRPKQQAVTYAWEDLHWVDPSTLELLTLFLAQVPTTRLLAVFTYRRNLYRRGGAFLSQSVDPESAGAESCEAMVRK